MPSVQISGIPGETSTVIKLYPITSDTLTQSVSGTESSNREGVYSGTTPAGAGSYRVELHSSGGDLLAAQYVDLLASGTFECTETPTTAIADSVLMRAISNVEANADAHSLATICLAILESSRSSTTWTIKRTDGATTHATKTLTLDSSANPVVGVT